MQDRRQVLAAIAALAAAGQIGRAAGGRKLRLGLDDIDELIVEYGGQKLIIGVDVLWSALWEIEAWRRP